MQRVVIPSKWDSPPASPIPQRPVLGKTTGRDIPLTNSKFQDASRQRVAASAPHSSVPDGSCRVRYRAPDTGSFVFDVTTGYRFDPTTGLHYDANSGFFINLELEVLLRWDPVSNTYQRAGDFAGLGKPMTIHTAVQKVAASVLLGNKPSLDLKATSGEGSKTRKTRSDKVVGYPKKKQKSENADESCSSGRETPDKVMPTIERRKRSSSTMEIPSQQRTREIDMDASRKKPNSPARQREDSGEVRVGRSRHRCRRSSKQSKCRSRVRRSVSRESDVSRTVIIEAGRSRSREPRRSHSRCIERSGSRESRRSHSRGSQRSDFREHTRSPSRGRKRSRGRVTERSRSRSTSNLYSRVTRRSYDRETDRSPKPRGKPAEETPEVIVIDTDDEAREETPEETPERTDEVTLIDSGDVLGHLFTNSVQKTLTNILLIAPVPLQNHSKGASDALKNQLRDPEGLLKVYVNHENTSGSPCHFMVVSFKSANTAKQWYDSQSGTVVLRGKESKLKGYLHFLKRGNWNCKHCKSFNFYMQSICPKCYRAKDSGFSPVSISEEPTKMVGLAKLNGTFSTVESVTESLPPLNAFNILSIEMISEPTGLPLGLCIFEVGSSDKGSKLHEFFLQQGKIAVYVTLNGKPKTPDEVYLDVLFDKIYPTNTLHVALVPLSNIPNMQLELSLMEIYLLMLLKEDGVKYNGITLHVNENVGAPYSYVLITFANSEVAEKWLVSRRKTFDNFRASNERSKISLHFSEDDWECLGCHILNFSLRSMCHRCFKGKEQDRLSPISQSVTNTKWVAVSKLSNWSKADEDIIADFRALLKEFVFKRIEVVRDSKCQPLPLACVFEMHGMVESLRLKEYLTKVGRFSEFVVVHKDFNEHTSDDPSDAPDLIIVEEPPPECIDLTAEDNLPEGYAEFAGASNVKIPVVGQQSSVMEDVPILMSPDEEQPSPLRISYTVPFRHPADIITVAPVPYPGENARNFYTQLFLSDGAECIFVDFCRENDFGVSYNYCLLYFRSSESANDWFSKRRGFMKIECITFPDIKIERFHPIEAHFHFLGGNWLCNCGIRNSPTRSICFTCYTQRGEAEAPLENSSTPTRYLGVKLYRWYPANALAYTFSPPKRSVKNIFHARYQLAKIRYVSDPMISRDNFGFYLFETKTLDAAVYLRDYWKMTPMVKSTGFVVLKDPTAGAVIELDFTFAPVVSLRMANNERDFDLISGNMIEKPLVLGKSWNMVCPDFETFLWTSLYEFHLNGPPTNVVLISLCPGDRQLPLEARVQIQNSLRKAGVNCMSITYSFKGDVGSPFSYCSIVFNSPNSAKAWFDKCEGTFIFRIPNPDDKKTILNFQTCLSCKSTSQSNKSYFIESKLHYFLQNWLCPCGTSNFPLRTVCHKCFVNRRGNSAYHSCTEPTTFVGIRLAKYLTELDVSYFAGIRKLGYNIVDVQMCLDKSLPRDPFGVIIFTVIHQRSAVKLHKFLTGLLRGINVQNPHLKELMTILNESRGITYMKCLISLQSTWTSHQSENWDKFFSNEVPTNIIAIYHLLLTGPPPVLSIPIEPFGGTIKKFKRGGGFAPTFWLIYFPSPEHAKGWHAANNGILRNESNQLNLYFTQGIWTCAQCFSPNFPARLLCHKCYAHRMQGYSPLHFSASPTRWVGVTSIYDHEKSFACLKNRDFKFRSVRIVTDPVVRLDGPSVLVFEVSTPAMGMKLRNFLAAERFQSDFFVVHESSESMIHIDPECWPSGISEGG